MPGQNLLQSVGAQAQKQTHFVSLFTSRFFNGLYTNRSLFRGPLDSLYTDFYHMGATDALCDGLNTEVSVRQTMTRRPGNPKFCTQSTAAAIDAFYAFHRSDGTIQVIADSTSDVEVLTPTTETSIFTKTSGAGEGYFQGIDKTLFISDGIDTVKYMPVGINNPSTGQPLWNWSSPAPTTAPTTLITETGSAGIAWTALTVFSTMGFIVDGNTNVQQMISVNAKGTNVSLTLGTTSSGQPNWNAALGGTTPDGGTVVWKNYGPVGIWKPNTVYTNFSITSGTTASPCVIYDPGTNSLYGNTNGANASGTSGSTRPHFTGVVGSKITENTGHGGITWFCIGLPTSWRPSHTYVTWLSGASANGAVVEPVALTPGYDPTVQEITLQACSTAGTSGTGTVAPFPAGQTAGNQAFDGDIVWRCLGSATRLTNHAYIAWGGQSQALFSVIKDSNNNMQVCVVSGTSSAVATAAIPWETAYGSTTEEVAGGLKWVCVGPSMAWAASTQWYLPQGGFAPPTGSQPYGGANVIDTNNVVQYVISSGKSGASAPAWAAVGLNTTDSGVTWHAVSTFTNVGFAFTAGMGYCYSFKARRPSDVFCTTAPPLQIPGTNSPNTTILGPLGPPTGCGDGSVTTASPVVQITGANAGAQITLTGLGSTDPQFDTIEIFRSAGGFGSQGPYLFLTDIPMPPVIAGAAGTWKVIDFMPDLATSTLPGLNELIEAPIAHENDPVPGSYGSLQFTVSANNPLIPLAGTSLIGQVFHQGRLWGFIGNSVFASGGPDTIPGNGFTAWPPTNVFPFDSNVVALLSTSSALMVFTTTDICIIGGGPAISSYYSQKFVPGVGLLSPNALTAVMGIPYLFTSDRQLLSIDPSGGITRIGHPIGDKLTLFDPSLVYLTYHTYGDQDHALVISDGLGQWYRCDINPAPDGKYTGPVWSPKATIAGGFKAVESIETSPGTRQLLIGPSAAGFVLARDSTYTTFTDNGSPYSAFFVIGNVVLAHAGQMAELNFVTADFAQIGTQPIVQVIVDEISATNGVAFETISNSRVSDPPKMYGPTATPKTMWSNRYYFGQTTPANVGQQPQRAWCKSLQLKIDFGVTDTVQNELYGFTLFGALNQEK